jgi:hypothetical protein
MAATTARFTAPLALSNAFQVVPFDTTSFQNRPDLLEHDPGVDPTKLLIKSTGAHLVSFSFSATNANASDRTLELQLKIDGSIIADDLLLTIDRLSSELGSIVQTAALTAGTFLTLEVKQVEAGTDITLSPDFLAVAVRLAAI